MQKIGGLRRDSLGLAERGWGGSVLLLLVLYCVDQMTEERRELTQENSFGSLFSVQIIAVAVSYDLL